MNIRDAHDRAPPTPACFPDRESWASYLLFCQQNNQPREKPFDKSGRFRPQTNWCADCTPEQSRNMDRAGRCNPSQFRGIPIVKESVS